MREIATEDKTFARFVESLPDPDGAKAFLRRLEAAGPSSRLSRRPLLLSRLLTLASYSPFLGETLLRHPEHITWLDRETGIERDSGLDRRSGLSREADHSLARVKSTEKLSEELARFIVGSISTDRKQSLARFKRRELLRTYLRDCLGIATLSELTEELSNLADAILADALAHAHQEMTRLHGLPLERDERGRVATAEMAVVALGKLGCRELNYASDIDLFFLYSSPGETAGDGQRQGSVIPNKEFFAGVAERVTQTIGTSAGEGAAYRIDLRLRPYGRDGDLVWDIDRAVDYYRNKAENWERQTLIRARASAGSQRVAEQFMARVRDAVFSTATREDSFASVRRVKEKIDRAIASRSGGFNVKLGPGGIREIEFVAQALQLEHGGRQPWVRSTQTLIVLARLAEKGYLSETERARLSAAYTFLRTVEHRLQMEHGAQTHALPTSADRLRLVARRCGYLSEPDPAAALMSDLESHTAAVRAVYNRIFAERRVDPGSSEKPAAAEHFEVDDETSRAMRNAAHSLEKLAESPVSILTVSDLRSGADPRWIEGAIRSAASAAINPPRSLKNLSAWADSLSTYQLGRKWNVTLDEWPPLIERLTRVLSSQYLANILVSRPHLAQALIQTRMAERASDYLSLIREALEQAPARVAKGDALRRAWYERVIEIGYRDMMSAGSDPQAGAVRLRSSNLGQTALAEATLAVSLEIALEAMGAEPSKATSLPFAVLALGRLGHAGMDYGSDLDLLVVFDDDTDWPPADSHTQAERALGGCASPQEFYAKLTSQLVTTLGSITREGMIYRVDLRLRPEGKNGPLSPSLPSLLSYIANRASAWEHAAYLKVRGVAGCRELGERARQSICEACFEAASQNRDLKQSLREMRLRLEREKARGDTSDIKWGPGGMTDAYFVTRYLQLAHRTYFAPELGTGALIAHLRGTGALAEVAARALLEGYTFLRTLDHWVRLLAERPQPRLPASTAARRDICRAMGYRTLEDFETELTTHTARIREVFDETFA